MGWLTFGSLPVINCLLCDAAMSSKADMKVILRQIWPLTPEPPKPPAIGAYSLAALQHLVITLPRIKEIFWLYAEEILLR